jgi:hypothetical protein
MKRKYKHNTKQTIMQTIMQGIENYMLRPRMNWTK